MVNVTFSLPEETIRKLRQAVGATGRAKRGSISNLVDAAINEHLREMESKAKHEEFRAIRDDKVLASAPSLRELASILKSKEINPRGLLILSSSPLPGAVRTGPRRHAV